MSAQSDERLADLIAEVMVRSDLTWGRTVDEHPLRDNYETMADAILAMPELQALARLYEAVGALKINMRYDDSTEVDQAYNAVPMSVHLWAELTALTDGGES